MPNLASAKKRVRQDEKRRVVNFARKSAIKTAIKKTLQALENNDLTAARELLKDVQAQLGRAKNKGVMHRNTAARKVSGIAKRIAAASR